MESTKERDNAFVSVAQLGFKPGQIIQEFCWDDDVDEDFRQSIMEVTEEDMVDEDYTAMADGSLIWWRDDDGGADDLSDLLMDATGNLDEGGIIWVLTPVSTSANRVEARVISEAAKTAGLNPTSNKQVCPEWVGTQIVTRAR